MYKPKNIKLSYMIANIKRRCYDENNQGYKNYGGRGITICAEWLNKSGAFIKWALENGYSSGLEIDRIDNNGNYEPGNCRFVTKKVNLNNKRNNRLISVSDQNKTVAEWVDKTGITRSSIKHRLTHGWDIQTALSKYTRATQKLITYKGETKSISAWAKEINLPMDTFWRRLYVHKWTIQKAIETPLQMRKTLKNII